MAHKAPCPPPLPMATLTPEPLATDNIKPLFWTKIVPSSKNTIWHKVSEQQKLISFNEDGFVVLFQKKGDPYRMRCSSPVTPLRILNDKKFQAIQILLRNISWEDIIHLMESLNNVKRCSFDVNCLSNVATMVTANELKRLKSCSVDSLEQPERLVLKLFDIENFREKVRCLQYVSQYNDTVPTIRKQIEAFETAYKSLYKPDNKLSQILALILTAGNKMNASSMRRKNAYGFRLEILPELKDVRSSDGSSNLLEFIVQNYVDNLSVDTNRHLITEFPLPKESILIPASMVDLMDLKSNCKTLESELQVCRKCCTQLCDSSSFHKETLAFIDESFRDLTKVFQKLNDLEKLFDEVSLYYCLEGKDYKTKSEQFLQYWISFIQSFSKYWERAVQEATSKNNVLLENEISNETVERSYSVVCTTSTSSKIVSDV